jgi:hypothetical protein
MFVFPVREGPRRGNFETIEEGTVDRHVAIGQMVCVHVDPARGKTDSRPLDNDRLPRDLRLDYRKTLSKRVIGESWRGFRPQEVGEIVARKLFARFQRETNEEGEVLSRTKPHLVAGNGEQGGTTQAMQYESVSHMLARVLLIRFKIKRLNQRRVNTLIY